jgi:hypothetical protein
MKRLYTKASSALKQKNLFSCILLLVLLTAFGVKGWGQVSYLGLDGGFEGSATIDNTNTYSTPQSGIWSKANSTQTLTSETTTVRSGGKSLKVNNSSTSGRRVWSPSISITSTTSNVTVQYYIRVSSTTNSQEQQGGIINNTEGLVGSYSTGSSANTWTKITYTKTSSTFTSIAGLFLHRQLGTGGDMFVDDMCVYTGSVDNTAANAPTSLVINGATTSSLNLSWTAASGGVDGGGYIVVRGTSDPTIAPNVNGIYAVGNTIAAGMTVVYNGTATSFTDNSLAAGTTYYYRVYTYDKAYNYSGALTGSGTTTSSGTPTLAATPGSLTGFTYVLGSGPSNVQNFALTGTSLNGTNVTLTPSTNYEISTSNSPFAATNPITLTAYNGTSTTIYVRLKSGLAVNTYNGETISIAGGGASTINETCSGSVTAPAPVITVTGSLLTFGSAQCINTASSEQSYTVSGSNLTANIVITPPAHYEISTGTGGSFVATSPINLIPSGGTVNSTTIYVRFKPTSTGAKTGDITHTSTGATTVNQATHSSTGVTVPTATATTSISSITTTTASSGGNFSNDGGASITARGVCWNTATAPTLSNSFSTDGSGTGSYTSSITGLTANTTYYVRSYATNACGTTYGTSSLSFTTLKVEPTNNATGFVCGTTTATDITFTWTDAVTGSQAPDKYLILCNTSGTFSDPVDGTAQADVAGSKANISQGVQTVTFTGLTPGTTYYFKVFPYTNATTNINYKTNGTVLTGSCATTAVSACGTAGFSGGTSAPAGWTFTAIGGIYTSGGNYGAASPSLQMDATNDRVETAPVTSATELSFWIKGQGTDATSALLVEGYNGSVWSTIENITNSIPTTGTTKTYNSGTTPALAAGFTRFRFTYTKSSGNLAFDDVSVSCAGGPTITTTGTISAFGNVCTNTTTAEKSYTVAGTLLTDDIIITPPVGYEVSKTSGSGFVANPSTLTLTQSGGNVATTTIYVRFVPTAAQSYNDIISNSSIGATDKNVSVSGTGVASMAPTVTTQTSASVGTTTATLGGNITVTGCSNVTERGIYWSTTNGFADGTGTKVSVTAGPYSTGVFTQAVTGLTANTAYYYKAFATSADGTGYTSQGTFTTLKAEPTVQPTNFAVGGVTTSSIPLSWTAASPQPDKYLIKLSTAPTAVVDPIDGTDPANVTTITSGVANMKTGSGATASANTFDGMTAGTMYNYKIYSLNNSGTNVDFLLTGAPALNHATLPNAVTGAGLTVTGSTTADISWTAASGYNSTNHSTLVFIKATSAVTQGTPTSAPSTYTANTVFGSGTNYQNDASAKCVYKGDGTSVSITGLSASTTYYVLIYTVVDASNSNSTNSYSSAHTANGTTLCSAASLPYTQNFDGVTQPAIPSCMTVSNDNSDAYAWVTCTSTSLGNTTSITPHSGTNQMGIDYNASAAMNDWFFTPGFNLTNGTTYRLTFWIKGYSDTWTEKLDVKYGTSPAAASMTSGTLSTNTSINLADYPTYTQITADFTPSSTGVFYIGFHGYSDADQTFIFLDDIGVAEYTIKAEPANHPTSFACGTTTSSSIPLTWTDATGSPAPDSYLIKWSTTSYASITAPADGTAEADGTTTKNITQGTQAYSPTGLSSGTTYYFKIWSYTNSGTDINYKTDGTIQQTSCTTQTGACLSQSFEGTYPPASWTNSGTSLKTSGGCAGTKQAQFANAGDYLITPALSYPSQLTFQYKRSGDATAWSLKVQYCATVSGTYTDITTVSNATTNCQTATVNLPAGCSSLSTVYLKFLDARSSGANERYIDDINVFCSVTSCSDPTLDASSVTFSSVSNASMTVNWTNGDGARRLVVARESSAVSFTPTDNTTYASTSDFSAGTDLGSGNKVVYSGTASAFTMTGLNGGSTYYFKVFEYNCTNGLEQYYTLGTPATASQTCKPNPVTNLDVTCMTNSSAIISWTPPDGSYDGVIISMRNSTNDCHAISNDASSYTASTTFGSGTSYGSTTPYSFVVYKGTGTSVTVNAGLTAGQPYKIMAYTYKNSTGSLWSPSSPTSSIAALGLPNVSSLATAPANGQVQVTWTNPVGSCWDEVMVVAKATTSVTASPSGNGSAYSANAAFGSGTAFDGGYVVYKGTDNNVSVTALTNGSSYCFKVFIRSGTSWSSGTYDCETPMTGTSTMVPGSIAVLGVCSNTLSCGYGTNSGDDEFSIVTFQDITAGTTLDMTDNGWKKCASGYWGNTEGYMRIKRTSGTIPAGTIITFRLNQGTGAHFTGIYPDNNWSIEIEEGSLIMNSYGDQIYFMQGGVWDQGTTESNDATYTGGTFLFAFNTNNAWTAGICITDNNNTGGGRSQNSGLYDEMECFNMMPSIRTDYLKYSGDMTATTQRGWIERIKDADNWNGFTSCASYYAASPDYSATTSIIIAQGGGGYTAGLWTGAASQDWFDCGNWGNLLVPDKDVDVVLPANATYTAANNCVIGAPPVGYTAAACKNFSNNLSNFAMVISNSSSKLDVYGNFTNSSTFTHSNGIVTFKGTTAQSITGTPIFYDLTLDNSAGLTIGGNIQVANNLTLSQGVLTTNANIIDLGTTGTIYENYPTTLAPSSYVTGNVKATRFIGGGANQTFGGLGVEINETGGSNLTVVARTTGTAISAGAGSSITRYFDITPANNNSLNSTLVFHYFDHEIGGYSEADLELFRSPSPYNTWYSQTGTVNSSLNTTTKTAITAFSRWTLANKNSPLPVSLLNFSGDCKDKNAYLTWTTASETNNDYFSVEKSLDMIQWNLLGTVDGAGSANNQNIYNYTDFDIENNPTYYRLKQTDFNGNSEIFDPISVSCRNSYVEFKVFPNPASNTVYCTIVSETAEKIGIEIINTQGSVINHTETSINEGDNKIAIDLTGFESGLYYVLYKNQAGEILGRNKMIIQKQ